MLLNKPQGYLQAETLDDLEEDGLGESVQMADVDGLGSVGIRLFSYEFIHSDYLVVLNSAYSYVAERHERLAVLAIVDGVLDHSTSNDAEIAVGRQLGRLNYNFVSVSHNLFDGAEHQPIQIAPNSEVPQEGHPPEIE